MAAEANRPIIVRRDEEDGEHAHHGGGWKVAYADFMTAMMAFFLLLWILAAADEDKLEGLANYFTPTVSAAGERFGDSSDLRPLVSPGPLSDGGALEAGGPGPSFGEGDPMRVFDSRLRETPPAAIVEYAEPDPAGIENTAKPAPIAPTNRLEDLISRIEEQIAKAGIPEDVAASVRLRLEGDKVAIDVVDADQRSLFARGRPDIRADAHDLITAIGETLRSIEGQIEIIGHTDATLYGDDAGYSNWELSADRANVARRVLMATGIALDRFSRVSGVAASQPANPADPFAAENRRISIWISPGEHGAQ